MDIEVLAPASVFYYCLVLSKPDLLNASEHERNGRDWFIALFQVADISF